MTQIKCKSCGGTFSRGMMRHIYANGTEGNCKTCNPYGGDAYSGGKVRKWDQDD